MTELSSDELKRNARTAIIRRDYVAAQKHLEQCLLNNPDDIDALCLKAIAIWRAHGNFESAELLLERARSLSPEDARILTLSAELLLHTGKKDEAWTLAENAIEQNQDHSPAYVVLSRIDAEKISDLFLKKMNELAKDASISTKKQRYLINAIGRIYDVRGDYDKAFSCFTRSNQLAPGTYQPEAQETRLSQAKSLFTQDYFLKRSSFGLSDKGCIFIIGMPRSGSTLLEQILSAHPETDTCGESDAISTINQSLSNTSSSDERNNNFFAHFDSLDKKQTANLADYYLQFTTRQLQNLSAQRRIDKRLSNFLHLPLIKLMFPDTTVLHINRHPLDVCLSCYMQDFDAHFYSNNPGHLAHYYLTYHDYIRLWSGLFENQIQHCCYERFVKSTEEETRKVLEKCGLEWNENCARPHKSDRFVTTASAMQVREPINQKNIGRWKNYEKPLQTLIEKLGGLKSIDQMHHEFCP